MANYWALAQPSYDTDYSSLNINGRAKTRYSIPGIDCHSCGETWATFSMLPTYCPDELKSEPSVAKPGVVPVAESHRIVDRAKDLIQAEIGAAFEILPGVRFAECSLDIPSRPEASVLWSVLGNAMVISKEFGRALEACGIDLPPTFDLDFGKVGKRNANLPPPLPKSGEPIDLIREAQTASTQDLEYSLVVLEYLTHPADSYRLVCDTCGRRECEARAPLLSHVTNKDLPDMIWCPGVGVVISDGVRECVSRYGPTNVELREVAF